MVVRWNSNTWLARTLRNTRSHEPQTSPESQGAFAESAQVFCDISQQDEHRSSE